ncbi:MAG: hypothetical protein JMDDDDMK_04326 [Acidobacteria bacterium]|nr:hypothetical protein [Acidobacteriota bacterium]
MWEKVFEIFKRFFTISDELKRLQADSKLHGEQIRELIDNQTRLYYEFQLQKERNTYEREKETLRIENQQLRERLERLERLLPSATADKKPDEK